MIEKLPGAPTAQPSMAANERRRYAAGVRERVDTAQAAHAQQEAGRQQAGEQIEASLRGALGKGSKRALRSLIENNQ